MMEYDDKLLLYKVKIITFVKLPINDKYKWFNFVKLAIDDGITPNKLLLNICIIYHNKITVI